MHRMLFMYENSETKLQEYDKKIKVMCLSPILLDYSKGWVPFGQLHLYGILFIWEELIKLVKLGFLDHGNLF